MTKKRPRQLVAHAVDADLALLHPFQQRRLRARAGAVDLVGQDDVGEDRAAAEGELRGLLVVNAGAGHVRRQQVGCELDAPELGGDAFGQRAGEHRFAHPRHVFQQHVPVGQQPGQHELDHRALADDDALDVADDAVDMG